MSCLNVLVHNRWISSCITQKWFSSTGLSLHTSCIAEQGDCLTFHDIHSSFYVVNRVRKYRGKLQTKAMAKHLTSLLHTTSNGLNSWEITVCRKDVASLPDWIPTRNNIIMKRNVGKNKLEKPEMKSSPTSGISWRQWKKKSSCCRSLLIIIIRDSYL